MRTIKYILLGICLLPFSAFAEPQYTNFQYGTFNEAQIYCQYLENNGIVLSEEPQDIWKVPKIAEVMIALANVGLDGGSKIPNITQVVPYENYWSISTSTISEDDVYIGYWDEDIEFYIQTYGREAEGLAFFCIKDSDLKLYTSGFSYGEILMILFLILILITIFFGIIISFVKKQKNDY